MRTQRLLQILEKLRGFRRPVAAQALADIFHVSLRTMYRDMADLQAMGAPVCGEPGLGYQLKPGYFLPPLHFEPDELDAIVLGMHLVAARGDEELAQAARGVTAKISAAMPSNSRRHFERRPLLAATAVGDAAKHGPGIMRLLRLAIRQRAVLEIEYRDLREQYSVRCVHPLGLTMFDQTWLLTTWCQGRNQFRNFRLERLLAARRTGESFVSERGQRFDDYLKQL
ncbi:YafY family protein [Janthinobacterium sp. UMAB-56]|uniref:helix-turn-helix transcriptional regulator n=1 Tax=Janthinobacterium sp. UMAB-56 TaxID=1365361 RepID=UPI001C59640D|nr:YafY family protein [Janthinobacterium sp. UMAB-56]